MTIVKTRAIVINSIRYGEADLIVTFLTEDEGMLKGIAKGALKSRKRFAGSFEPFTLLELTCKMKESGGLARIDVADITDAHYGVRENLERIEAGSGILELVSLVEVSGPGAGPAFKLLRETLGQLEKTTGPEAIAAIFFIKYLGMSGFKIPWESCSRCGRPLMGNRAYYGGGHGLFCGKCKGNADSLSLSPGSIAFISRAEEIVVNMMGRLKITNPAAREVFGFLGRYIESVIGKSLKTLHIIP